MANFSGLAAAIGASILIGLSGCASTLPRIRQLPTKDQAASRGYQTRAFDTADAEKTLRVVISTLQDFDFIIEEANSALGVVSAVKPDDGLQINVTVRPKDETQVLVQASMNHNTTRL